MHTAYELLAIVLGELPIYGGAAPQLIKLGDKVKSEEIDIRDFRGQTLKSVASGEISWRSTLLGGCTKPGPCDSYMLGQVTDCLSCEGSAINPEKLDDAMGMVKQQMSRYKDRSAERQILEAEFLALENFKSKQCLKRMDEYGKI
ncbi:TPA: hypothetical protein U8251_000890 [Pseudomonas putida]|nr:hypothetical protein [Pseudomonas putida]